MGAPRRIFGNLINALEGAAPTDSQGDIAYLRGVEILISQDLTTVFAQRISSAMLTRLEGALNQAVTVLNGVVNNLQSGGTYDLPVDACDPILDALRTWPIPVDAVLDHQYACLAMMQTESRSSGSGHASGTRTRSPTKHFQCGCMRRGVSGSVP